MLSCKQYNPHSYGVIWQYMRTSAVMEGFWSTLQIQQLFALIVMSNVPRVAALSTCLS